MHHQNALILAKLQEFLHIVLLIDYLFRFHRCSSRQRLAVNGTLQSINQSVYITCLLGLSGEPIDWEI